MLTITTATNDRTTTQIDPFDPERVRPAGGSCFDFDTDRDAPVDEYDFLDEDPIYGRFGDDFVGPEDELDDDHGYDDDLGFDEC